MLSKHKSDAEGRGRLWGPYPMQVQKTEVSSNAHNTTSSVRDVPLRFADEVLWFNGSFKARLSAEHNCTRPLPPAAAAAAAAAAAFRPGGLPRSVLVAQRRETQQNPTSETAEKRKTSMPFLFCQDTFVRGAKKLV